MRTERFAPLHGPNFRVCTLQQLHICFHHSGDPRLADRSAEKRFLGSGVIDSSKEAVASLPACPSKRPRLSDTAKLNTASWQHSTVCSGFSSTPVLFTRSRCRGGVATWTVTVAYAGRPALNSSLLLLNNRPMCLALPVHVTTTPIFPVWTLLYPSNRAIHMYQYTA